MELLDDSLHIVDLSDLCLLSDETINRYSTYKVAEIYADERNMTAREVRSRHFFVILRYLIFLFQVFMDYVFSLKKWFMVIYLANSNKKGVNSHAVARQIGVTQKTSWFMLQRIKNASVGAMFKNEFEGTVEIDECHIGGSKTHHQKNTCEKTIAF